MNLKEDGVITGLIELNSRRSLPGQHLLLLLVADSKLNGSPEQLRVRIELDIYLLCTLC
jgi:hypothetical protein